MVSARSARRAALEWALLPRELKQACRVNRRLGKVQPNLAKKTGTSTTAKKKTKFNIDFNAVGAVTAIGTLFSDWFAIV